MTCCLSRSIFVFTVSLYAVCAINVISIVDINSIESTIIKVHSIIESASSPASLHFGFLVVQDQDEYISESLRKAFRTCHFGVSHSIKSWDTPQALRSLSNKAFDKEIIYARFYLPHVFQEMDRYIYLDNDIVVNCDLSELFVTPLEEHGGIKDVMAFVFDDHPGYVAYMKQHFNLTHPLVQQLLALRSPSVFMNAGVALVDAARWRQENYTARAEEIMFESRKRFVYSRVAADQGLFPLLLMEHVTMLPARYNMRRLPSHTMRLLAENEAGIIHFAGFTRGDESTVCKRLALEGYYSRTAGPLYLSIVASLHSKCPEIEWKLKDMCAASAKRLDTVLRQKNLHVTYNPGNGQFTWPPKGMEN